MTKQERIQKASSNIQTAIILDLASNVTDSTKRLIAAELELIYESGVAEGALKGFGITIGTKIQTTDNPKGD